MEQTPLTCSPPAEEEEEAKEIILSAHLEETVQLEEVQEGQMQKKKKGKMRRKKQKSSNPESVENLLTELPFANVNIGAVLEIKRTLDKKMKKKRQRKAVEGNEDKDASKKQKRANYFVSIPIINPKIHEDIQTFQDTVLQRDEKLTRAMSPKGSFHLTLFVVHLASEEEIKLAVSALLESKGPVEEVLQGKTLVLSFRGAAEFKHEVVFGKMTEGDSFTTLKEITDTMVKIFKENGIFVVGYKGFVPHLTFMKLSRSPKLRKQGLKKIDPSLYKDFQDHYFGDETLDRIDLCSIIKKRQPNGYYHTEASIYLDSGANLQPELRSGDKQDSNLSSSVTVPEVLPASIPSTESTAPTSNSLTVADSSVCNGSLLVNPTDNKPSEDSSYIESDDTNKGLKLFSAHLKAPVLREEALKREDARFTSPKQKSVLSVNAASDSTRVQRNGSLPRKSIPGQTSKGSQKQASDTVQQISKQNTQQVVSSSNLTLSSQELIAEMVSLEKQKIQAEREHWEVSEKNMSLLFERLTTIQNQQRYTNKNLKSVRYELSLIGKQLSQLVQLFQSTAGIVPASQPLPIQPASGNKESVIEQPIVKKDLPTEEDPSLELVEEISNKTYKEQDYIQNAD
ncbi:uncharacterized protein WCC33_003517 [Rhinophrynus dorsalis]